MGFRSKYESAKPFYIYYKILPLETKHKANPGKIYMETHPKSAPRLYTRYLSQIFIRYYSELIQI